MNSNTENNYYIRLLRFLKSGSILRGPLLPAFWFLHISFFHLEKTTAVARPTLRVEEAVNHRHTLCNRPCSIESFDQVAQLHLRLRCERSSRLRCDEHPEATVDRKRHYVLASRKLPFGRKSLEGSEIAEADTRVSWRVVNGVVEDVTDVHRRVNLVSVVALARPTNAFFFVTTIYIESFVKARPTALVAGRSSDLSAKIPTRKKWCPHARRSREESFGGLLGRNRFNVFFHSLGRLV